MFGAEKYMDGSSVFGTENQMKVLYIWDGKSHRRKSSIFGRTIIIM